MCNKNRFDRIYDKILNNNFYFNIKINSNSKTKVNTRLATSIPSAIRTKFDIKAGDELYWDIEDDKIIIKTKDSIKEL